MIPIVSLIDIFAALLCGGIFLRILNGYKRSRLISLKYFALTYFFLGLLYLLFSVPGVVSENGYVIAFTAALAYLMLNIAIAYLLQVPLLVYRRHTLEALSFYGILTSGIILFFANIYYIQPAARKESGLIVYYLVQEPVIVRILVGVVPVLIAVLVVYTFFREGRRIAQASQQIAATSSNQSLKIVHRSFTIAWGLTVLTSAGALNFIIYALIPHGSVFVIGGLMSIAALIIIFRGIEL